MATTTPRRMLVFKIQKRLLALSMSQLQTVASAIDDGSGKDTESLAALSEPELFDLIVDFLKSEKLRGMEDEGMSQILHLDDMLGQLQNAPDGEDVAGGPDHGRVHQGGVSEAAPLQAEDTGTRQRSISSTETMDSHLQYPPGESDIQPQPTTNRDTIAPARTITNSVGGALSGRASLSSSVGEQVVKFTDVAALFPRREFKIYGGQISDIGSEVSYSSLCKQMDQGILEGFSESEVIRTVLKITKPGTFREMLTSKDDLTVIELKRFLRSHIRDKNSSELYQELSTARQQDKEGSQQFFYRIMGLKQRVIFESQQPGAEFCYDKKLVQGTFLHTLYQGLNEKNNHVRCDLKPFLSDLQVNDDLLLELISKSTSEENDRLKRLGTVSKTRPVSVNAAQTDQTEQTGQTKQTKVDLELQANRAAILELTAQVTSMAQHFARVVKAPEPVTNVNLPSPQPSSRSQTPADNRGRCRDCVQKNIKNCPHCFVCGQAGHRAVGCLQRKASGNEKRSQE